MQPARWIHEVSLIQCDYGFLVVRKVFRLPSVCLHFSLYSFVRAFEEIYQNSVKRKVIGRSLSVAWVGRVALITYDLGQAHNSSPARILALVTCIVLGNSVVTSFLCWTYLNYESW